MTIAFEDYACNRHYHTRVDRGWSYPRIDERLYQTIGLNCRLCSWFELARALFGTVAEQLAPALGTSITIAQILSFILIWVAVPIGCSLVASVLTKALDVVNLGWLNRLAGALLGAVKVMLLIGLGIYVLEYIDPKNEMISKTTKKSSLLYSPMKELVVQCLPVVKDMTDDIKDVTDKIIK